MAQGVAGGTQWIALGQAALVGIILFQLSAILFSFLRKRQPYVFEPRVHSRSPDTATEENTDGRTSADPRTNPDKVRDYLQRKYPAPQALSPSWFGWIYDLLRVDDQAVLRTKSADAVAYLWFLKLCIFAFAFFTVLGIGGLVPIDLGAGDNNDRDPSDPQYTEGIAVVSMANLSSGSGWHLAHLLSVVFNTVFVWLLAYYFWKKYRRMRTQILLRKDLVENYSLIVRDVPKKAARSDPEFEHYFGWLTRHYGTEVVMDARLGRKTLKLRELVNKRIKAEKELEHAAATFTRNGKRPLKWVFFLRRVDAIEYWSAQSQQLQYAIDAERLSARQSYVRAGVVTFVSRFVTNQLGQVALHRKHDRLNTVRGVEPAAVHWWSLRSNPVWRVIASVVVGVAIFFLTFFWFIPVSFVAGLANLQTLANVKGFGWVSIFTDDAPAFLSALIQGLLPTIVLLVLMEVIPPRVITLLERQRGLPTLPAVDRSVFIGFFTFQVFNVLLFLSIAGSILQILQNLIESASGADVIRLLGTSLPQQSFFFTNYIVVKWGTRGLGLLRPSNVILRWWQNRRATTATECRGVNRYEFPAPLQAARDMLVFYIGLTYSSMSPLIAPCALVFFVIAHLVTKYNMINVYTTPYTAHGELFPTLMRTVFIGLILYQITMIGVFSIKVFPEATSLAALCIATILMWVFLEWKYDRRSKFLALNQIDEETISMEERPTSPEGRKSAARDQILLRSISSDMLHAPIWRGVYVQPELLELDQDSTARQYFGSLDTAPPSVRESS